MLSLWLLLACAPHAEAPPPLPAEVPAPVLPSPEARRYAVVASTPRDVLVERLVREGRLPWEESLSGAAAGLALDSAVAPTLRAARWAAVRSGYPHPIVQVITGVVPSGELPVDLLPALMRVLRPGDQLGLVRARAHKDDQWIALVGRPAVRVEPFAREYGLGEHLQVGTEEPGQWLLVSPEGGLTQGALPLDQGLAVDGEWWLELRSDAGQVWMGLPVYVGMATPKAPIFEAGTASPGPEQALAEAGRLLNGLRGAFDLPGLRPDPTLANLARQPLEEALAGAFVQEHHEQRLRAAGFVGGPVASLRCVGPTVADCLDGLLTRAEDRARLLAPGLRLYGGAAEVRTDGVNLVLQLASE